MLNFEIFFKIQLFLTSSFVFLLNTMLKLKKTKKINKSNNNKDLPIELTKLLLLEKNYQFYY